MAFNHDRAFYRLQYPPQAAPTFVSGGATHPVIDIGEGGFRYSPTTQPIPLAGEAVSGVLHFPEEDPLEVAGTVVRLQGGEIAVKCAPRPIPLALVLREQLRLRRRFPFRG